MSAKKISNIPASVRARLFNEAAARHRPFSEVLQHYAMERFLFRLASTPHRKKLLLKGALMLRAVDPGLSRPTMDIDLLGRLPNDHASLKTVVEDCVSVSVDDGITFDTSSIALSDIVEEVDYHGVRIMLVAFLGTARIPLRIDVGFGDRVTPRPIWIEYPELLDFGTPRLRACPPDTAIAEKLQVMVHRGALNSRMKDFYDIYLMQAHLDFEGAVLLKAITATFSNRGTTLPAEKPLALDPEFVALPGKSEQWQGFVRRLRLDDSPSFASVVDALSGFLMPVLRAASTDAPFDRHWPKNGPWNRAKKGSAQ